MQRSGDLDWPFAYGGPQAQGGLRTLAEDFVVEEELGFAPDGAGQHLLLQVRKRNTNTEWVARQIARVAEVPPSSVSYAGLKDRRAVTTQWFSVDLAGRPEPDWQHLGSPDLQVLMAARHGRKLRRGALRGNRFLLTVRNLSADKELEARLEQVARSGVPNYFGDQRFGRDGGNLLKAQALFEGRLRERNRHKRGLYLSAARSLVFNTVLAARVEQGTWHRALPGDALLLDGSRSYFVAESIDAALLARLEARDVHPTGPLWGRGEVPCTGEAAIGEIDALVGLSSWLEGLAAEGLQQERRSLRVFAKDFSWRFPCSDRLELSFGLPAGSYATAVLRELIRTSQTESAEGVLE